MDNAIFKKLSDIIQYPTHSKEWFGMAEQAINTIYALGEHPDVLCNEIIKALTKRVFVKDKTVQKRSESQALEKDANAMDEDGEQEQDQHEGSDADSVQKTDQDVASGDTGDAFELSQLIFVVGHVAIKQIVYLELVEREWKRQKDEKEKGSIHAICIQSDVLIFSNKQRRKARSLQALVQTPRRTAKSLIRSLVMLKTRLARELQPFVSMSCYTVLTRFLRFMGQ